MYSLTGRGSQYCPLYLVKFQTPCLVVILQNIKKNNAETFLGLVENLVNQELLQKAINLTYFNLKSLKISGKSSKSLKYQAKVGV